MKEARIVCLVNRYRIKDLTLDLVKGQEKFLSEAEALGSLDLRAAKLAGAVGFQWVERSREIRPASQVPQTGILKRRTLSPAAPVNQVDLQVLVDKSVKAQMADLRQAIVGDIREALTQVSVAPEAPRTARGTVGGSRAAADPEEAPLFIPEIILGAIEAKAEIHVEAETADDDLDEAQEALRALRKRKGDKG